MIEAIYVFVALILAIMLDWSIFTHLSAYFHIAVPSKPDVRYRDIGSGSFIAVARTTAVAGAGMVAGLAFALKNPSLWLGALGSFVLIHSLLYVWLYKRREKG